MRIYIVTSIPMQQFKKEKKWYYTIYLFLFPAQNLEDPDKSAIDEIYLTWMCSFVRHLIIILRINKYVCSNVSFKVKK